MPTSTRASYHHGDLRASLLMTAMQLLEQDDAFSLRAVARQAGVSPTAPYRHFADREALESALAAQGLRDLQTALVPAELPTTVAELAEVGVAYVEFALRRPALFRLMFGSACDDTNDERVLAAAAVHDLLQRAISSVFPTSDAAALATAGWGLVHGLACLHLDGKLPSASPGDAADRVRASFAAVFAARPRAGRTQRKR